MGDMVGNAEFTSLSQEQKNSLLLTAAQSGDTLACENLIKSGAELECRNNSGLTPLMLAAEQGHTQSCLKLIDHQAHVNALSTGWENTALLYAAQNGKTETCIALLEQGADISLENDLMLNPLSAAFQKNHDETCFALIEKGASLTKIVDSDLSPLLAKAAKAKRKTVCEILMQAGANVSGSMILLAKDGATEGCLFQAECDPDRKLDALQFAFNIALENQQLETCLALIEEGIDLTEVKNHGKNDLFLAALEEGKTAVCKKLLDAGADLGEALVKTSQRGNTTMCLMIIQMAPEDMKSNLHKVALIGAARSGNAQMCLDLIKAGADVKTRDSEGKTPLFYALGHLETFAAMLQAGAAIDVTDEKGNTPLMFLASSGGKLSVLSTLIEKGADINAKNKEGMSVLQMAAWNPELFLALLKNGADPSVVTQEMFNDLLAAAVQDGKDKIFEQLLKIAPDLNLQIDEPQLLSLAMFYNNSNIINILLNNNDNILVSPKDLHEIVSLPPETAARLLPNLSIDRTITLKSLLTPLALKAFSDPGQVNEYLKALRKFQSNLRQYIRLLPLDSIAHKDVLIAWDIQDAYARVKKYEDSYRDNSETAMSPREMSAAKTVYEVAQNLYSQTFQARCEQYENDEHEAIESIEKEIRDMLLDKLSAEGDENTKAFITQNRETLSLGQDESMMEQASSRFNATDNALHIAWRAYDKYAPTTRWINLFTPPTVLSHQYGAGEQSTDEISWDVRKRAAFYFLALKDKTYAIDNQEDREGFYIGEIAEIRRAHNEADQGQDNPSCYPGTIGRIGKMGRGHSQLAVVNPIEQIPTFVQGLLFEKVKDFMQGKDKAIQARMIYALSAFTVSTIEDTLAGKNVLAAFDVTQEELQEVAKLHNEIIASIGNPDEIFNQLNEFFKNSNPPIRALVEQEKVYVQRQLSDIAYKGVGPTVAQQFRQEKITNPYSQETPRVSMQDFIRPLQQFKQKHQLSFNVMEIAKLCSQNNDEQAIDKSELNGEQRQDFEACLQTVRAKVPALKQKLDEKRELWQELYEALRNAKTQVNSQSLKAIVDEMVDHGKDIKKAFKKYNISLPENTVDKTPFDTMSKAERRKSLQLSKSDSEKPLTQAVDMPPKVKKGKRPS